MLLWDGACIVHEEFRSRSLKPWKEMCARWCALVHPESPIEMTQMADAVGSTSQLIKAAQTLPHKMFIVATDRGIFIKCSKPHQIRCLSKRRRVAKVQPVVHVRTAPVDGDERFRPNHPCTGEK